MGDHPLMFAALGVLADQCERVSVAQTRPGSGGAEVAPFGRCGGTVGFEVLSAGKAAFLVEMVEDRSVNSCKPL